MNHKTDSGAGRRLRRPFIAANFAISADAKIATAGRIVHQFGSRRDQDNLHALRARADAILCAARTIEHDNATLGPGGARFIRLRQRLGLAGWPLRVVVSGAASISPDARIFKEKISPIVLLVSGAAPAGRIERLRPLVDDIFVSGKKSVDWPLALDWLYRKWHVRNLLCEGGSLLNSALLSANLIDQLHLTICPFVFGGRAAPTIADGPIASRLENAVKFQLVSARHYGEEMFLVFRSVPTRKKVIHAGTQGCSHSSETD